MNIMLVGFANSFLAEVEKTLVERDIGVKLCLGMTTHRKEGLTCVKAADLKRVDSILKLDEGLPWIIDAGTIDEYKDALIEFLRVSDRLTVFPISVKKRIWFFYHILNFLLNTIRSQDISHAVFPVTPHMGWDCVLLWICRNTGIRTLIMERTHIGETFVFTRDNSFTMVERNKASEAIASYIDAEWTKEGIGLQRSKRFNTEVITAKTKGKPGSKALLPKSLRAMKKLGSFVFSKTNLGSAVFLNQGISKGQMKLKALGIRRAIHQNKASYEDLCGSFDPRSKYVYVPLHLQPEKTTLPLGGWFEEQLLMLRLLRESLPSDISIYVREHPRQFSGNMIKGSIARDRYFYGEMAAIPGVTLIPIEVPSDGLVDQAMAIATITGSTGWEALKAGKPVLLFGNMWYEIHPSCHKVRRKEDIAGALRTIGEAGGHDPARDMKVFLGRLAKYAYIGTNFYENAEKSAYGFEEIIALTCDSICEALPTPAIASR